MTQHKSLTQLKAFALHLITFTACGSMQRSIQQHDIGSLGRLEYRTPQPTMKGIMVGTAPRRLATRSATLARTVSHRIGAGFVAAYGFTSKRIAVAQPSRALLPTRLFSKSPAKRRSVFREFKQVVRDVAGDEIDF